MPAPSFTPNLGNDLVGRTSRQQKATSVLRERPIRRAPPWSLRPPRSNLGIGVGGTGASRALCRGSLVIRCSGISKRFGRVCAVDELSFTAEQGAVTVFLGPNGAGKTTTIRMLLGLTRPGSGAATFNGVKYSALLNPAREVGAVLETLGAAPAQRVDDYLKIIAVGAGLSSNRVAEVLNQVELEETSRHRVRTLSLGMRQRLALAGALLGDPAALILDEPANGLDPQGIRWLRRLLRELADEGRAILVSSHQLAEMEQLADAFVIVRQGRLVAAGSAVELLVVHDWVQVRSADNIRLQQALGRAGLDSKRGEGDAIIVRGDPRIVGLVAARSQIAVYELTPRHESLEEFFLGVTGAAELPRGPAFLRPEDPIWQGEEGEIP